MFFFDASYLLYMIPGMLLSIYASMLVKSRFAKYSKVRSQSGYSGAQVAQAILHGHGIQDVKVEASQGRLSDHYDPRSKTVRLSPDVYNSTSVAALGIAAHETGHAIQHAEKYAPLVFRNLSVPVASIGTNFGYWIFIFGFIFSSSIGGGTDLSKFLMSAGIVLFATAVVFSIVTLPVEINASTRAVALLTQSGVITTQERSDVKKVLNAAAMTYVAAAISAIMMLVWMLVKANSRN